MPPNDEHAAEESYYLRQESHVCFSRERLSTVACTFLEISSVRVASRRVAKNAAAEGKRRKPRLKKCQSRCYLTRRIHWPIIGRVWAELRRCWNLGQPSGKLLFAPLCERLTNEGKRTRTVKAKLCTHSYFAAYADRCARIMTILGAFYLSFTMRSFFVSCRGFWAVYSLHSS